MEYSKYNRTYHLPWSEGVQSDDKVIKDLSHFEGKEIVVSEKLDGENTSMYSDYYHARSIDSKFNYTRAWIAKMHSVIRHEIPSDYKLVLENMWGEHSIRYENLRGYGYLLSVWKQIEKNDLLCLSFDEYLEWAELLDLPTPQVFHRGIYDESILQELAKNLDTKKVEGYIVRLADSYKQSDCDKSIAKFVRAGHVQPDGEHWLRNAKQNGDLIKPVMPYFMG